MALQQHPGNWLILNMVVYFLGGSLYFVGIISNKVIRLTFLIGETNLHTIATMGIVYIIIEFGAPISMLLITIEKLISIKKYFGKEAGFTPRVAIGSILGTNIFVIVTVLTMPLCFAIANDGIQCVSTTSILFFIVVLIVAISCIIITILTIIVAVKWCKLKTHDISGIALPLMIANTIYILNLFITAMLWFHGIGATGAFMITCLLKMGSYILVPLIWITCLYFRPSWCLVSQHSYEVM